MPAFGLLVWQQFGNWQYTGVLTTHIGQCNTVYVLGGPQRAIDIGAVVGVASISHNHAIKAQTGRTADGSLNRHVCAHAYEHQRSNTSLVQPTFKSALRERIGHMLVDYVFVLTWSQWNLKLCARLAWPERRAWCA